MGRGALGRGTFFSLPDSKDNIAFRLDSLFFLRTFVFQKIVLIKDGKQRKGIYKQDEAAIQVAHRMA